MTEPPSPYVVGVMRSGTTLMRAMLTSHPDLAIPDEAIFRVEMSENHKRYQHGGVLDVELFLADLGRHPALRWWSVSATEAGAVIRQERPRTFPDAIRALFRHYAQRLGKSRFGDKTPAAVNAMPLLAELFPETRFIHMIRDAREVALSHINVKGGIHDAGEVAVNWRDQIERGRRDGLNLGPKRYREVRYDDLVADPERVLRPLCEYIDLPFDMGMGRYFERAGQIVGSGDSLDKNVHLPPTKGLRNWRRDMRDEDVEVIEAIAGDLLEELGYERVSPRVTPRASRRARVVRVRSASKERARRLARRLRR